MGIETYPHISGKMDDQNYIIRSKLPYSGYTIDILPLPPHYMDVIEEMYPLQEYPKRKLTLLAGDVVFVPYTPLQEPPSVDADPEGHDLYYLWHTVDEQNDKIRELRRKARPDLLYSMCVSIIDGPKKIEDDDWVQDINAPFVEAGESFDLSHPGYRKLMFIKTQVVRHITEHRHIMNTAMYEEVDMQGIEAALRGFRTDVGSDTST